jgi:hypothetical protein
LAYLSSLEIFFFALGANAWHAFPPHITTGADECKGYKEECENTSEVCIIYKKILLEVLALLINLF